MTLKESILKHEGFRENVYKDTLGYDTVGIGFLVSSLTKEELALNGGKVSPMSKEVALKILDLKLEKLIPQIEKNIPFFNNLPISVKEVLIEMCYQMGIKGVLSFKNTLKCIENGDYCTAADNLLKSKWASQTPVRAKYAHDILKNV